MVGWLVQDEQIRVARREPREREPASLPAREDADGLEDIVAAEAARAGKGAASERSPKPGQDPRLAATSKRRASAVRRVSGLRALEARISAMELQLRQLSEKVSQIAQSGNYMETRRVGEEYASLERDLRTLYDEWAKESEKSE